MQTYLKRKLLQSESTNQTNDFKQHKLQYRNTRLSTRNKYGWQLEKKRSITHNNATQNGTKTKRKSQELHHVGKDKQEYYSPFD